jgi:pyridoxal phosphate enzyme (YggS family)
VTELADRLTAVRESIADSARRANRDPSAITTIVVTKFHPASLVRELCELGVHDVGENRHQDAHPKARELSDLDLNWHFVGQLQSKKARAVAEYASIIHSVDRGNLVAALEGQSGIDCFIQVNLTDNPSRGGVEPADLDPLVERVAATAGLRLLGLMAVAPLDEEPRRAFSRVRALSARVTAIEPAADKLSIGMSADYPEAILEGATHLRIGTAITGKRPDPG